MLNHRRFCRVRPGFLAILIIAAPLRRFLVVHVVDLSLCVTSTEVAQEALDGDVAEVLHTVRDGRDQDAQQENSTDDVDDHYGALPGALRRRYKVANAPGGHRGVAVTANFPRR